MTKDNIRFCDRCKKQIEPHGVQDNPHDIILLGWRTSGGISTNERHDICAECADSFDRWMNEEST